MKNKETNLFRLGEGMCAIISGDEFREFGTRTAHGWETGGGREGYPGQRNFGLEIREGKKTIA